MKKKDDEKDEKKIGWPTPITQISDPGKVQGKLANCKMNCRYEHYEWGVCGGEGRILRARPKSKLHVWTFSTPVVRFLLSPSRCFLKASLRHGFKLTFDIVWQVGGANVWENR